MTNLEYPWNLLSLSSVDVPLGDWSYVKQFTAEEAETWQSISTGFITLIAHAEQRTRCLLDIQHHGGVGLLLILLIIVEQNLLTAYNHILQIFVEKRGQ